MAVVSDVRSRSSLAQVIFLFIRFPLRTQAQSYSLTRCSADQRGKEAKKGWQNSARDHAADLLVEGVCVPGLVCRSVMSA